MKIGCCGERNTCPVNVCCGEVGSATQHAMSREIENGKWSMLFSAYLASLRKYVKLKK